MENTRGKISFDALVIDDDDDDVEGCYRLVGESWKVFYFTHYKRGELWSGSSVIRKDVTWPSGVKGVDGVLPKSFKINKESIKRLLSEAVGVAVDWVEVRGPDSLQMK